MTITSLINALQSHVPQVTFVADTNYYWSPQDNAVHYDERDDQVEAQWSLLHEAGHALMEHRKYYSDIELVQMELEAWEKAQMLASDLHITIDPDHIEDCLDSYRDWLYKRSLCPDCRLCGIQTTQSTYRCLFCHKQWSVSNDRFCRPYRRSL